MRHSALLLAALALAWASACGFIAVSDDGGSGGGAGGGTAGGSGGTGGTGGSGGSGGGGASCSPACGTSRTCCSGRCVNTANDLANCGGCGVVCSGATPYCGGSCQAAPCEIDAGTCGSGGRCCGASCCAAGQLCCDLQGPVSGPASCYTPTAGQATCPQGCAPLCASDRALKSDLLPADERAVLEELAQLPLSTWRYTDDPVRARHLGPMAQDFRSAFALGDTDRSYHSIDAHGVSLASIKALYRLVLEQQARLERLEAENARLRSAAVCGP